MNKPYDPRDDMAWTVNPNAVRDREKSSGPTIVGEHGPELIVPPRLKETRMKRLIRWLKGFLPVTRREHERDLMRAAEQARERTLSDVRRMLGGYTPCQSPNNGFGPV